ncbi:MAG: cyclic nucleotide-binding domain-containing protein [bacterium]|nr:cyclic nucleotide-binding domain-containing protein [bacterium]MCP4965476.1 cyclic nucleotide-binding domain-containing protein [bacterium]
MTEDSLAKALGDHDFFRGLQAEQLDDLAAIATKVEMARGDLIFAEGGHADSAYAIVDGSVALELKVSHRGNHIMQTLHSGEMLGWGWLFPPHRWSFSALALDPTTLIRFDAEQLRLLQDEDCALGYVMMKRFAQVMTNRLAATRLQLVDFYGNTH